MKNNLIKVTVSLFVCVVFLSCSSSFFVKDKNTLDVVNKVFEKQKIDTVYSYQSSNLDFIWFFKNDTITSILDIIISENKKVKSLNINLIDEKEQTLLMFKETDSIYNCDNFGGIYYYKNIRFFLSDYSERINFDKIIDGQLNLDSCEYYLAKYHSIIDTEEYVYEIDKKGKVYYPNGEKLIYKDSIIQLKFWRENR